MVNTNMNAVLNELQQLRAAASNTSNDISNNGNAADSDFSSLLSAMLEDVNTAQVEAQQLAHDFESGAREVNVAELMVAREKARLSFQALLHTRNKLIGAYQDIMNMPL